MKYVFKYIQLWNVLYFSEINIIYYYLLYVFPCIFTSIPLELQPPPPRRFGKFRQVAWCFDSKVFKVVAHLSKCLTNCITSSCLQCKDCSSGDWILLLMGEYGVWVSMGLGEDGFGEDGYEWGWVWRRMCL